VSLTAASAGGAEAEAPTLVRRHSGRLDLSQALIVAFRAIRSNPLRSGLTALGVIIGVAAVIALTSIGQGSTANITQSLEGLGTNLLTIGQARFGGGGPGIVRQGGGRTITLDDVQAIRDYSTTRIVGVAPVDSRNAQAKAGANNAFVSVIGTTPDYEKVRNATVDEGSFFSEADNEGRKRVAVIGYDIVQDLFEGGDAVGQKIKVDNVSFTVVGTIPDKGNSGFNSPNQQVIIPLGTYQQRIARGSATGAKTVSNVYVQGASKDDLSKLQEDLTDLLMTRHEIADPASLDFSIQNQADSVAALSSVTNTLTLFLGGVAGISLLVGGIGIMNIMLVSVTERTREIGIRKALGAKPRDILTQFLVEAFVLSVGGGLIGIAAGFGLGSVAGRALNITPVASVASILAAFIFSAAVGLFFGLYPASRAARLDPVESLRYE
jgi:putative ABC transport system permease protein